MKKALSVGSVLVLALLASFNISAVLAAISFGSVATAVNSSDGASTIVINKPANTVKGDFLIAGIVFDDGRDKTITPPTNWTLIRRTDNSDKVGMATYYKVAGGAEPSTYSWGITSSDRAAGGIIRYTGVDTSDPIDVHSGSTGNSDKPLALSVTTTQANDLVIAFFGVEAKESFDPPSLTTKRYDLTNPNNSGPAAAAFDFTQVNAGSTGNKESNNSGTHSDRWVAQIVALKAVPPAPSTGSLTITKNTVGGDDSFNMSGTGDIGSFSLDTSGGTASQTFNNLTPGSYTITETVLSGWDKTSDACQNVQVVSGQTATCTITNTKKGHIIINKVTIPSADPQVFNFNASGGTYADFSLTDAETPNDQALAAGTYLVDETVHAGWDLTSATCDDGSPVDAISLQAGETVTCTFTNTKRGKIIVNKVTVGGDANFDFTTNYGPSLQLRNNGSSTSDWLVPGTYFVSEIVPDGWDLTSASCSGENTADRINLQSGEIVTCTFTNTKRSSVTIMKAAEPDDGPFTFTLTGPSPVSSVIYENGVFPNQQQSHTFSDLFPGTYQLQEQLPENWEGQQSVSCTMDQLPVGEVTSSTAIFTLPPGKNVSCLFNNTEYGSISGTKFHDLNANGQNDNEPPLKGWTITLTSGETTIAISTETDESGVYAFTGLLPGTYRICENQQDDASWYQSFPTSSQGIVCGNGTQGYEVVLAAGENASGRDFGNYQNGSILGVKFNDLNGNGIREEGEPGIGDWTIELYDSTGQNRLGEQRTAENGSYAFTELVPATYVVKEVLGQGWQQTKPVEPSYAVLLSSGQAENKDFGNYRPAMIVGYKWHDLNADGVWQKEGAVAAEPAIGNWAMALGRVSSESTTTVDVVALTATDETGRFALPVNAPGEYLVFEAQRENWRVTSPAAASSSPQVACNIEGCEQVTLRTDSFFDVFIDQLAGQEIVMDGTEHPIQFGNVSYLNILGAPFAPLNGNASSTPGALALDPTIITVAAGSGTSTILIPAGTVITRSDGENFDLSELSTGTPAPGSLAGLGTGVVVDGALEWGITGAGLTFNPAITVNIFVGTDKNGVALAIVRSVSGSSDWTSDGVSPTTCVVTDGICSFTATKASYYAATHTTTSGTGGATPRGGGTISSGGSGGGGGGGGEGTTEAGQGASQSQPPLLALGTATGGTQPPAAGGGGAILGTETTPTETAPLPEIPAPEIQGIPGPTTPSAPLNVNAMVPPLTLLASIGNLLTWGTGSNLLGFLLLAIIIFLIVYGVHRWTGKSGKQGGGLTS